ncbi:hypothetical protein FSP39_016283 [Pinctada imbricata]|uniref:EF-hand domain-containing protein n=1 Tax=Pinctada imbricata TaxID=66713 RepID=A0AA88Y761_PINIB|nr:hypothetical protein FSP39_016283 [Pinctada imbricata]
MFVFLLSIAIFVVDAKPWAANEICHKTDGSSVRTYIEYGTAIVNAVSGNPTDLAILGTEYLTECLVKEYPRSKFLEGIHTGLQCAKTADDAISGYSSIKSWFRVKRGTKIVPSRHGGRLDITVVAGEFLLRSLNLTKEIPIKRVEGMDGDSQILPCKFDEYDQDRNNEVTNMEFDEFLHDKGFWPNELLFRILSRGHKVILPETFHRIAPSLHEYLKFERCQSQSELNF